MSRSIGGQLDMTALAALHGMKPDDARMIHFRTLSHEQQSEAVGWLAATGMSDYGISHACGLAVEQVCRIIGQRQERA
jgi:uncharacterized protein YoaH (UPF0181 family)